MDTSKLVAAYVRIRDTRNDLKKKFDEQDAELKSKLDAIEQELLNLAKEHGMDSIKTAHGTASRQVMTRYWAPDWDSFTKFLDENGSYDLLERRIHQGNFKQFLEDNPDVKPPVNADSRYVIRVRRGNK